MSRRRRKAYVPRPDPPPSGYVPSLPYLGTTWMARGPAYWWRRVWLSLILLFAAAVIVGWLAAMLWGVYRESRNVFLVLCVILAVASTETAIVTWWQTAPSRITTAARSGGGGSRSAWFGAGMGTLARSGSVLASLLIFVGAMFTVGPILVVLIRSLGRQTAAERRERLVMRLPDP